MLTQLILFSIELLQLKTIGRKEYFGDLWNWLELAQSLMFLVYFIMRCIDHNYIIPVFKIAKPTAGRQLLVSKKGEGGEAVDELKGLNIEVDEKVTD